MPAKKLTARKRAELKQRKLKEQRRSGFPVLIVIFVIIVVAIVGTYLVFSNLGTTSNDQDTNGQVTNTAPSASEDYSVFSKNSVANQIDVLTNDNDPDNDEINITSISDPSYGTAELTDGNIFYTPETNFTGVDSFKYSITDGEKVDTSTIHIFIADVNPIAIMETNKGTIVLELYEDKVPITAGNFIDLANDGYYDGIIFHRVIRDFMIQGGDPTGTGAGGHAAKYHEGYGDPANPDTWRIPDEFHDDLKHDSAGILSMANAGPNTGGSQFFITVKDTPWLDGAHAVFGKVIEGLDVVIEISELDPDNTDDSNKPFNDVIINSIIIGNDWDTGA